MQEKLYLDGRFRLKVNGEVKLDYHNAIVSAGLKAILQKSIGIIMGNSAIAYNKLAIKGAQLYNMMLTSTLLSGLYRRYTDDDSLACVFLSLTPEQLASVGTNTRFIKTWDTNALGSLARVKAYVNNNIAPVVDGKEGRPDYLDPDFTSIELLFGNKYVLDAGVGTGTINAIALMPKAGMQGINGIRVVKCLDKVNRQYANFGSYSTDFLPPGVTGYTEDDEILYNFSQDGKTKHKYNMTTKAVTDLTESDNWLTLNAIGNTSYTLTDYMVLDGYLYVLKLSNVHSSGNNIYLYTVDLSTGEVISTVTTGPTYTVSAKFCRVGSDVFIIAYNGYDTQTSNYARIRKLTKSGTYYNGVSGTTYYTFVSAGITVGGLGNRLNINGIMIKNYGDNYAVFNGAITNATGSSGLITKGEIVICSDLSDIYGSIIDIIPDVNYNTDVIFKNTEFGGTLELGNPGDRNTVAETDNCVRIENNTSDINISHTGLWLSTEENWSNTMTIAALPSGITKGALDVWELEYGIEIGYDSTDIVVPE